MATSTSAVLWRVLAASLVVSCAMASIDGVTLNNGITMPVLNLGTTDFSAADVEVMVLAAVEAGFRGIQASFSPDSQAGVGRALKSLNRSAIFVTAKTPACRPAGLGGHSFEVASCENQTQKDIDETLQRLGLDFVDLLLLQGANHDKPGVCGDVAMPLNEVQWAVYEYYYVKGMAKAIGVADFCVSCLEPMLFTSHFTPAINQVDFHVGMTADPEGLMSYSRTQDLLPLASAPMGAGDVFTDPVLLRIGALRGKSAEQVALKWIVAKGYPIATEARSHQNFQEQLAVFSWELSTEDMRELDAYTTASGKTPTWACAVGEQIIV